MRAAILMLALLCTAFEPTELEIDSAASDIRVIAEESSGSRGHRHVVQARWMRGSIAFDAADPSRCRVRLEVPVKYLAIDPPGLRHRLGWVALRPHEQAEVQRFVESPALLFSAKYPAIRFSADRCEPTGAGLLSVSGELEIRGVTKPIQVTAVLSSSGSRIEAHAVFDVRLGDFGMQPFRDPLRRIGMAQQITIVVRLVAGQVIEPGNDS